MKCPFCKAEDTRVIDSRDYEDGLKVRRRRECPACQQRFTTYEEADLNLPLVWKRDNSREKFDEAKLRDGMARALYKRPVDTESLDKAVAELKLRACLQGERELPARQLGEWVMEALRDLDQVAYVRFASVYRRFEDVNAFRDEIERLQHTPTAEQRARQASFTELADSASAGDGAQ